MDGPFNLIAYCSRASGTRGAWGGAPFNSDFGQYQKQNIFIQKHFYLFLPPPRLLDFPPALSPSFIFMIPSLGMLSVFSVFFDSTQFSGTDSGLPYYLTANYIDILPFTLLKVAGIHRKISFRHPCTLYFHSFYDAIGQLISKCPFGIFKSSKKPTIFFPRFLP